MWSQRHQVLVVHVLISFRNSLMTYYTVCVLLRMYEIQVYRKENTLVFLEEEMRETIFVLLIRGENI